MPRAPAHQGALKTLVLDGDRLSSSQVFLASVFAAPPFLLSVLPAPFSDDGRIRQTEFKGQLLVAAFARFVACNGF